MITRDEIVRRVCAEYRVAPSDLLGRSRKQPIAAARQVAIWLYQKLNRVDGKEAGEAFAREQTTGRYALAKVESTPKMLKVAQRIAKTI